MCQRIQRGLNGKERSGWDGCDTATTVALWCKGGLLLLLLELLVLLTHRGGRVGDGDGSVGIVSQHLFVLLLLSLQQRLAEGALVA